MILTFKSPANNKIQPELASYAVSEDSKPTDTIRLQSNFAALANPVIF